MDDRLYFRQLLAGRDFARSDPIARQMVNFVYLVGDRETGEAVVIDPAYDIQGLLDVLAADDMRLTGALATHYHPDHIGGSMAGFDIAGIETLLDARRRCRSTCRPTRCRGSRASPRWPTPTWSAHASGDTVMAGEIPIELIHTPGHTPGSQCFLVDGCLVSGDTLFLEGCGRTDLPGGDPAELYRSLTQKLAKVPDDTVLFPGHLYSAEPSATMSETRRWNYVFKPGSEAEWLAMFGR